MLDKNESDITYVAHYSTGTNNYLDLKENGTYVTTVMANLEGKMPMKFIYNEYNYNSSAEPYDEDEDEDKEEETDHTLLIILLVTIPIIIILIIVLIIILVKKSKQKESINVKEGPDTRLINDTRITNMSSQE